MEEVCRRRCLILLAALPCSWNYTAPGTNDTEDFNGTCGTPGVKSAGPWCYVEPSTCKYQPIKDQSGQSYDNCAAVNSTHTMDTGAGHRLQWQFSMAELLPCMQPHADALRLRCCGILQSASMLVQTEG